MLVFPIEAEGRIVGLLVMYFAEPREATPQDLDLAAVLTRAAAIIISRHGEAEERAHAEQALRESEGKYRSLFESIDQGFCIIEVLFDDRGRPRDYRFLEANPAFDRETGMVGAVGRRIREMAPANEEHGFEIYGHVAVTGETMRFEHEAAALGRFYDVNAFRVGEPGQNRVAILFHDITDRKRQEANLAFLADVSQALPRMAREADVAAAVGAKTCAHFRVAHCAFGEVNEAERSVTVAHEWKREGGPSLLGRYPIDDYLTEDFRRAARGGEPYVVNDVSADPWLRIAPMEALPVGAFLSVPIVREGRWRFFLTLSVPTPRDWRRDEVELLHELAARLWTHLRRARAEEALRESEEKYRTLFDSMDEGYCIIQMIYDEAGRAHDWRFLQVNRAFEFNNGLRDATGRTIREMVPAIEPKWIEIYNRVAESGEPLRFEEDSDALGRAFTLYAFRIGEPAERKVAVIFTDITEQRRAQRETERARAEAEAANQAKDHFLAVLSHELRTPLAPVLMTLRTLGRREDVPAAVRDRLELMRRNILIEAHLIDDLLDITRIARGRLEINPAPMDLHAAVRGAVEVSRPDFAGRRQTLRVDLAAKRSELTGDAMRLEQVVWNLLKNASKFSPEGGEVHLSTRDEGDDVVIEVRDHGMGIAAEAMPTIFDAFSQAADARRIGGLGLGLAISRASIEAHGGRLEATSDGPGTGATFTARIPLRNDPQNHGRLGVEERTNENDG